MFTPEDAVRNRRELMLMSIREGVDREPFAQAIFDELATRILDRRLLPGDRINSVDLARQFGTSRTPVREALSGLERQRVVVIPPRRQPYIARATKRQVIDVYHLRASLFSLVSQFIIDNHDPVPLDELWTWQAALEEDAGKGDIESYFWHNVGFRLIEVKLSGSADLQNIVADLGMRTLQFRQWKFQRMNISQPERLMRSATDHRRLLNAYQDRDTEVAVAMTRSLIMTGLRAIEQSSFQEMDEPGTGNEYAEDEQEEALE